VFFDEQTYRVDGTESVGNELVTVDGTMRYFVVELDVNIE
jgi:hypothetical protein